MCRWSMGWGRSNHSVSSSLNGCSRSYSGASDSGSGTSGIGIWCSRPASRSWNEAERLKMARPCCTATTRRVVKDRPSRIRSTS